MKIKNIFGNEYSGTMGKAFIASHIGRTYYVKQYTKPTDARTVLQLKQRAVFKSAITAWHELSHSEKEEYNILRNCLRQFLVYSFASLMNKMARQRGKRGYNLFISRYVQAQQLTN